MSEEQSSSDEDSPVVPANRSLPRRNLSATTRNNIFSPDRVRAPSPPPATVPASPVALKVPSPVALKVPSPVALKVPSPVALKVPCPVTTEVVVPSPVTTRVTARTPRSVSGKTAGTALAKVTSAVDTASAASSATKLAASSAGGLDVAALAPHSVAVVGSRVKPGTPVKRPRFNTSEVVTIAATSSRRGAAAVAATTEPFEEELPSVRRGRGTPRKEVVGRVTSNRRGTKRQQPEPEKEVEVEEEEQESDEAMETEVSFKPNAANLAKKLIEMELTEEESNRTVTAAADQSNFNLASVTLPFDEPAAPKPRGGRKSMVASARKSLANEWPVEDQQHMLHFFDNLNPQQSETSRVALTCKYALIQYDRDLSSKLLYQWLERKDRVVNRQVTQFVLNEADQKNTVLELYRSLSIVPSEATKVSFTLKFIQAQYGVAVTSKQLFSWIKEKPKKGKK
uniref:Mediator of DNA damage checkpoint protein 1-like n=2 Tax=Hirondellea gigas TaxID=1518452 RepID=A0A6A7FPJ1_9CRUS